MLTDPVKLDVILDIMEVTVRNVKPVYYKTRHYWVRGKCAIAISELCLIN